MQEDFTHKNIRKLFFDLSDQLLLNTVVVSVNLKFSPSCPVSYFSLEAVENPISGDVMHRSVAASKLS